MSEYSGPVHAGMAARAEGYQLGVVAGAAVLLRLWGEGRRGSSKQKRNAEGRSGRGLASRKRRPKVSSTAQAQANIEVGFPFLLKFGGVVQHSTHNGALAQASTAPSCCFSYNPLQISVSSSRNPSTGPSPRT